MMHRQHSVFICLIMVSTAIGAPQINITSLSGKFSVIAPKNFEFYCSSSVSANFTIEVDGLTKGDKFDRISNESISNKKATFSLAGTEASDNGTTFVCVATINNTKYTSKVLTLLVYYSPVFYQSNSNAVLYEVHTGAEKVKLHCNVMANPTAVSFHFTNDSSNSNGVTTEVKGSNATIIFGKAVVDNRGTYNCIANNSIGSNTLTYRVFVGGKPSDVNISCKITSYFDVFQYDIVCKVHNDTSDAPAIALSLESPDLGINKTVKFQESDLPLSEVTFTLLNASLLEVFPNNYSLYLYAVNQLGRALVLNDTVYIAGLNINISISTDDSTVTEKESFNFTCSSLEANATYVVYVGGSERQDRLMVTSTTNTSQSYTYNHTTYEDDGRSFQCLANVTINGTVVLFKSPIIQIKVLYAPKYTLDIIWTPLNNTKKAVRAINGYRANPDVVNVTWTLNGTVLKNNTLPDQLILYNVLVKDRGNYTVHTCNKVGCGNGTVAVDVYWPPRVSLSKLKPAVAGHKYDITINITTAHPKATDSEWIRNGNVILDNGSRVTPNLDSLKFNELKQMDNGTYQYSVKNAAGLANISFILLVEFAPNITDPGTVGGLINTSSEVDVSYVAYPTTNISVKWYFNDTMIKDNDTVKVTGTMLSFSKLKKQNNGTYTVSVTNAINTTNASFVFWVYYGPEFSHNTNGSQWIEIRTNDSYNITCTVVDSNPPVTHVNFTYKGSSDNVRIIANNDTSTTLEITKASHNNTMNYTCEASTDFTKSHSVFQTFVGGPPDKVKIGKVVAKHKGSGKDATVTVSLEVTDDSLAPARNIIYNVKGNNTNHTIPLSMPIRSKAVSFDILSDTKVSSYGANRVTILFYAANDLGSSYVGMKNVTLTGSSSSAKKSHTVAIVVGVVVPVVAILLIIAAIAGGWYYHKTKKSANYSPLSVQEKDRPDNYGATS